MSTDYKEIKGASPAKGSDFHVVEPVLSSSLMHSGNKALISFGELVLLQGVLPIVVIGGILGFIAYKAYYY